MLKYTVYAIILSFSLVGCADSTQEKNVNNTEESNSSKKLDVKNISKSFTHTLELKEHKQIEVSCPTNWFATGGGYEISSGLSFVEIDIDTIVGPYTIDAPRTMLYRLRIKNARDARSRVTGLVTVSCLNPS